MKKLDIKIRTIQEAVKLLNRKGKNNANFGNRYAKKLLCIDCGKEIFDYRHQRCVKCGGIQRGLKLKGRKRPEHSKLMTGKGNPAYVDGNSYLPYTEDFTRQLKREIRERDNHECQLCDIIEEVLNQLLDVHHIDYNKENCSKQNLISLCRKCNIKVNLNRDFWFAYFTYIMEQKC